jgi:hypothetical protein
MSQSAAFGGVALANGRIDADDRGLELRRRFRKMNPWEYMSSFRVSRGQLRGSYGLNTSGSLTPAARCDLMFKPPGVAAKQANLVAKEFSSCPSPLLSKLPKPALTH